MMTARRPSRARAARPPPRPSSEPVTVQRRASNTGVIMIVGQNSALVLQPDFVMVMVRGLAAGSSVRALVRGACIGRPGGAGAGQDVEPVVPAGHMTYGGVRPAAAVQCGPPRRPSPACELPPQAQP